MADNILIDIAGTSAVNIEVETFYPQGIQGIQGTFGIQGLLGVQGTQGAQGAQGTRGVQGAQGLSVQGIRGQQGVQGISVQGVQGIQGPIGISAGQWGTITGSLSDQTDLWYELSSSNAILPKLKFLTNIETELSAKDYNVFFKTVTGDTTFTYLDFNNGESITLYLSAAHGTIARHTLPSPTYLGNVNQSNEIYTFNGYITKTVIQRIGNIYYGISDTIKIDIGQNIGVISRLLLDPTGDYLLQEDSGRILL